MKIVCTKIHYSMNYTEQNVIAIIVKKITHILTQEHTEKHVKAKQKLGGVVVILHLPVSPLFSIC